MKEPALSSPGPIEQFRRIRIRQRVANLLGVGAIAVILLLLPGSPPLKGGLVVAVFILSATFSLINWRCPSCKATLTNRFGWYREVCLECGVVLNPHDSFRGMVRTLLRLLGGPPV